MSGAVAASRSGPVRAGWETISAARPQLAATAARPNMNAVHRVWAVRMAAPIGTYTYG